MVVMMFVKINNMDICLQNDYANVLQKKCHIYTGADGKLNALMILLTLRLEYLF